MQLYAWDFNMFTVAEESGGRPLYTIVMALLQDFELLVSAPVRPVGRQLRAAETAGWSAERGCYTPVAVLPPQRPPPGAC